MAIVSVENLKMSYDKGRVKALKGVTFDVEEGEIFGLIGPDGAGKTSLAARLAAAAAARCPAGVVLFHLEDLYPGWDGLTEGVRLSDPVSGKNWNLGDTMMITIVRADVNLGKIDFEVAPESAKQ